MNFDFSTIESSAIDAMLDEVAAARGGGVQPHRVQAVAQRLGNPDRLHLLVAEGVEGSAHGHLDARVEVH